MMNFIIYGFNNMVPPCQCQGITNIFKKLLVKTSNLNFYVLENHNNFQCVTRTIEEQRQRDTENNGQHFEL